MLRTSVEVEEETWCGPLGFHYSEAKQPTQLFSSENDFLTHDLQREILIQAFLYFRTLFYI